ncbi:MAG: hypothetical protein WAL29_12185 [Bacteroidales bacterium]
MKRLFYISGLLIFIISGISCSDDFLEKNNINLYELQDTLFLTNSQSAVEISVQLPTTINSAFTIFMQPKWLSFTSMHGIVSGGNVPLSFTIVRENVPDWYQSPYMTHYATIMLDIENTGLVSFIAAYSDFGTPRLQCSVSALNFESSEALIFTISNTSQGILNWKITNAPDWLNLSSNSGTLGYGSSATINASLDLDNIPHGQDLSGTIQIESNSTAGNLTIPVTVAGMATVPPEVSLINGIVTDAEYNHTSGIMAICTRSPNSLIVFNTAANESVTIPLDMSPNCVNISEDGKKAVIGYSVSSISYFDLETLSITEDFTVDCIPFDIVLCDNNWCYITPTEDQWVYFRNLNLSTGELILGRNRSTVYERTLIKKIPGKQYLVGSRLGLSPTGILIFDVTKGRASDTISYYHESIENFWISTDGAKLYSGTGTVYSVPDYDTEFHTDSPPVFGELDTEYNCVSAFDECPVISSVFVTSSVFHFQPGYSPLIEQFSTTNLNKIKTFTVSPVSLKENGITTQYETSARFIFVNKEGTRLYALKNLKQNYNKDHWTMETLKIQ